MARVHQVGEDSGQAILGTFMTCWGIFDNLDDKGLEEKHRGGKRWSLPLCLNLAEAQPRQI